MMGSSPRHRDPGETEDAGHSVASEISEAVEVEKGGAPSWKGVDGSAEEGEGPSPDDA